MTVHVDSLTTEVVPTEGAAPPSTPTQEAEWEAIARLRNSAERAGRMSLRTRAEGMDD